MFVRIMMLSVGLINVLLSVVWVMNRIVSLVKSVFVDWMRKKVRINFLNVCCVMICFNDDMKFFC